MLLGIVILISIILIACNAYYETDENEFERKNETENKLDEKNNLISHYI
ncbi:hypothetical protein [Clostridium sp. C2-6-12]|nr:hypothetical protein [Clostridium sp. C2-6-12]